MTAGDGDPPGPVPPRPPARPREVTLGIFAGGRASRLGGLDKAWLRHDGRSRIEAVIAALAPHASRVLVAANRDADRYRPLGVEVVTDRHVDQGPLGGLQVLAAACRTPWLLSAPVDALRLEPDAARALLAGAPAFAVDDDGLQPLFACWPVAAARAGADRAIASGRLSVRELQGALGMRPVRIAGTIGNLNTPADLASAGIRPRP